MGEVQTKRAKTEGKARTNLALVIWQKILPRLEVKDLLRFKCVCHGWYDLISSSTFIHRHLELSTADPEQKCHKVIAIFPLTTIDYRYFGFHVERRWNKIIDKPLRYPRKMSRLCTEIVGSCDGLICLLSRIKKKIIIIWNPSSQELVSLPLPFDHDHDGVGFYWFGRDNDSNGYKLLVSRHCNKNQIIYELSSDGGGLYNWRECKDEIICRTRFLERRGTYLNGNVHWPCLQNNRNFVVRYNLLEAKTRVIPAPNVIRGENSCFTLGVLNGYLCAVCKPHNNFEIWMIRDYRLEQSWTRFMELEGFEFDSKFLRLLGTLRNGDLIVDVDRRTLERYYFNGKTPRIVKTQPITDGLSDSITYVESLISPIHSIQLSPELLGIKEEAALKK